MNNLNQTIAVAEMVHGSQYSKDELYCYTYYASNFEDFIMKECNQFAADPTNENVTGGLDDETHAHIHFSYGQLQFDYKYWIIK